MHDPSREVNKIARRRIQRFPADVNGQCLLLDVERLVLAMVNVRVRASARRDQYFGHEKGAPGLIPGDEERNLIYGALIGRAGTRGHMLNLRYKGVTVGASDRIGGGDGSLTCN